MAPDVDKRGAVTRVIEEDEQNAVPGVYGKAPNVLQLSVQLMRMKPRIERIAAEDGDLLVRKELYSPIKSFVAALKERVENDLHAFRSAESGGSFPALPRRRASRAQRKMSFSVTTRSARSISSSSSFFGMTTRSSLGASFFGIVIVATKISIAHRSLSAPSRACVVN